MKSVLLSIQSLLAEPNPDDPLNNEAAAEWKSNKKAAESKAKEFTIKYAKWFQMHLTTFIYTNMAVALDNKGWILVILEDSTDFSVSKMLFWRRKMLPESEKMMNIRENNDHIQGSYSYALSFMRSSSIECIYTNKSSIDDESFFLLYFPAHSLCFLIDYARIR